MRQAHSNVSERSILSTWREGLAQAVRNPILQQTLLRRQRELLPRFAEHYIELKTLPRRERRSLQRRCKQSLPGVALLLALGQAPALAATINVGGACTLVDAITAANTDTATGECPAGVLADTLILAPDSIHMLTSVNNSSLGPSGLPVISSSIAVSGNGATIRRANAAPHFGIFKVAYGADLMLRDTTVSGGVAISPEPSYVQTGGGVSNDGGSLRLVNSTISGNSADFGGGVRSFHTTIITNSNISDNTATRGLGGGIYSGGTLTITNSTISGNSSFVSNASNPRYSGGSGGGISSFGTLHITNSTVSGNSSIGTGDDPSRGGGLNNFASATVTNSTISGNSADFGGGIDTVADLNLTNNTITGNSAGQSGGGVRNFNALLDLDGTLISGNTAAIGAEVFNIVRDDGRFPGTVVANNFNLFGFNGNPAVSGFTPGASDIVPTVALNAMLNTTLANNGGPTQTHALVAGSPAVDAVGSGCPPPITDQRGVSRPQGAACDIGSFELAGGVSPPPMGEVPPIVYVASGDSVAAGQDIDGEVENKDKAYPRWLRDYIGTDVSRYPGTCSSVIGTDIYNIASPGDTTTDYLNNQLTRVIGCNPDLASVTIGANDLLQPALACIVPNLKKFRRILTARFIPVPTKIATYLTAVHAAASGCLIGLSLEINNYLDIINSGLGAVSSSLVGRTKANVLFTNYFNPLRRTGAPGPFGRTFEDFIGAINSYIGSHVTANQPRTALVNLVGAFRGHEIGTDCSYIAPLRQLLNFPLGNRIPFGVHPNALGQNVIASLAARVAREKGFAPNENAESRPFVACATPSRGLTTGGNRVTLHGADFLPGAVVSFGGKAAQVLGASSDGTHIIVRTPAHPVGKVNVSVNSDGTVTTAVGGFSYANPIRRSVR